MLFLRLLGRLPLRVLYLVSDIFSFLNHHVIRYRRKIILKNLKQVFPEMTLREHKKILRKYYTNIGDVMVEILKGLYITKGELLQRVRFKNVELVVEAAKSGKDIVLLTAHQGNWEWALQSANIQFPLEMYGVYKPLSSEGFDRLLYRIRTRFVKYLIPKDQLVRNLIQPTGQQRIIGIIGDQRPAVETPKYWRKFFDIETAFYPGIYQIPRMTNGVTVFVEVARVKRGYYECIITKIGEPPYQKDNSSLMDAYIDSMEKMIRKNPADWLWSHNRWKYAREIEAGV